MTKEEMLSKVLVLADGITPQEQSNRTAVTIPLDKWSAVAKILKTDSQFDFDMLCDHLAIDWPEENFIELVYQLYSSQHAHYLVVCVKVPRQNPIAPSVHLLWPIAEWQEREVYDLFGVKYAGHPDLRRLFLEDDWKGFPLLKDYKDDFTLERPW
jgi:NADH/F420H2 dehydrogenase subunit C